MLINTILVERAIEREGLWERLNADDRRALTPLFHGHINPYATERASEGRGRDIFCPTRSDRQGTLLFHLTT